MSKIDLENELKLLKKKQTKISFRMRDLMRMNQNRTTVEYDELKKELFEIDMKIIEVKEILEKEGKVDGWFRIWIYISW